ncbi:MAG: potassium-transporting ATPase subunit C [Actinomycetota bacterium]|jgi:K+-transporting ATPase ATPase C chain|nr:potassium-transporting ATPase subunit C [Actinomycetota bacterium]
MRRQLIPSILSMVLFTVLLGGVYSLVVTGVAQLAFKDKADGSIVERNGRKIGSSLIGQAFVDKDGNAIPKYFQSRPSAAAGVDASTTAGYDPTLSSGSNLGPSNPLLVGFIPGFNSVDLKGNPSKTNPFASPDDPYCVPDDKDGKAVVSPTADTKYKRNDDGSFVCDANTVPQRVLAYRDLNGLSSKVRVPVDAVTASASGLDPDISVANARLQARRVARDRGVPVARVRTLVDDHTSGRDLGVLGEKTVNVLELNLALDNLRS